MDLASQPDTVGAIQSPSDRHSRRRHSRASRTPPVYRLADSVSEGIIYAMVVLSVWAFASIPAWAVWAMNAAGYLLGLLLVAKWVTRWATGCVPSRWDEGAARWPIRLLAAVTVILVVWCLLSASNARAMVNIDQARLEYRDRYISWLPHSYDAPSSWFAFWRYLGFACSFWAIRDWLLGKTRRERFDARKGEAPEVASGPSLVDASAPPGENSSAPRGSSRTRARRQIGEELVSSLQPSFRPTPGTAFPTRLKRLLWVVCLNGGLVALEGTLQRLSGTNKLLWVLEPEKGAFNRSQFGPFDYYANAAQYLNLVWPVCLALWWCLREARRDSARGALRAGGSPHVLLLPAVGFLFAAAIFAGSRGGALVASGLFLASAVLLIAASTPRTRRIGLVSMALLALVAGGAAKLGGGQALSRLLAPPAYFSTGVEGGMSDFSLDYLLDCPTEGRPSWWYLAYLTPAPSDQSRSSAFLYMSGQALGLLIHGIPDTNRITLLCTNFVGEFGGRRVKVTAVKEGTNLSLYADGRQLSVVTYPSRFPPLTNQVGSSFLRVQRDPDPDPRRSAEASTVHQVRLYTNALSPTQVAALAKASSEEAGGAINGDQTPRPVLDISRRVLTSPSSLGNQLRGRTEIHKVGRSMASDFPWFGSGPGTFGPLFQLYRREAHLDWQWRAHNDWLETRITFGRAGLGFVLLALALVPVCHFTRQGASVPAVFVGLVWLALAGCMAHARFDYPFQVHSVLFAFLVWSAAASVVSGRR